MVAILFLVQILFATPKTYTLTKTGVWRNMKKLKLLAVLFVVAFVFSACQNVESKKSIVTNFNADFTASNENFKAEGSITAENGETELIFTSPKTINGLKICNGGGEISLEIDNLVSTADEAYLPKDNMPQLIHSVATDVSGGREILYQKNDEFDTYILETSKGKCTYAVDKNGYIRSAQINSKNFRIDFFNQLALSE